MKSGGEYGVGPAVTCYVRASRFCAMLPDKCVVDSAGPKQDEKWVADGVSDVFYVMPLKEAFEWRNGPRGRRCEERQFPNTVVSLERDELLSIIARVLKLVDYPRQVNLVIQSPSHEYGRPLRLNDAI